MKAFISYSHRDTGALERLHVHLAALRREGRIQAWFDREILAGDELDEEISRELEAASIFLLLVSPDFIASDYCVEQEMRRALERHEAGKARVVPVIIEPCDWKSMQQLRQLKALPADGVPISEWANANTAYLNIVQELRRIIDDEEQIASTPDPIPSDPDSRLAGVPRYRVQRDFDEIDRSEFRDGAFAIMKNYFQRAVAEMGSIDGLRARFVDRGPTSFGSTVVNQIRSRGTAHITVHSGHDRGALGDIFYSFDENAPDSRANGWFSVSSDEYEQFLIAGMSMFGADPGRLSPEQAAVHLWNRFIERAGITHA